MARSYLMAAVDSVTGDMYTWTSDSVPDFDGSGYPGPNTATEIQQRAVNDDGTGGGGGSGNSNTLTQKSASAVASGSGWTTVGEFVPSETANYQIAGSASVSDDLLLGYVQLWDTVADAVVSGSVTGFDSVTTPEDITSSTLALTGDRRYQVQLQAVGAFGADYFATLETLTLEAL